jgi:hypothetical protein
MQHLPRLLFLRFATHNFQTGSICQNDQMVIQRNVY